MHVMPRVLHGVVAVRLVGCVPLSLWRFKCFCDSRWLTKGPVSRTLVLGYIMGVEYFVKLIQKTGDTLTHRGGFWRL